MDPERRTAIQQAMLRLADGDRAAMPGLVEQLWPVLLSYAERGLGEAHGAEDVAQEVLFRISSRISEFDHTRDPLSWAFGIATFEIMTQRKRRQSERFHENSCIGEMGGMIRRLIRPSNGTILQGMAMSVNSC